MDASRIAASIRSELSHHIFNTFVTEPVSVAKGGPGIVVTGCVLCKKRMETTNQYLDHLFGEVLPDAVEHAILTSEL
jgi:hypothetical protein